MPRHQTLPARIDPQLSAVARIVAKVQRRQRSVRVIRDTLQFAMPLGLILAALILVIVRLSGLSIQWVWLATLPAVLTSFIAWIRPLAQRKSIRLIDQHYQLHDLIGNTIELGPLVSNTRPESSSAAADDQNLDHLVQSHVYCQMVEQVQKTVPTLCAQEIVPITYPSLRKIDVLGFIFLALATQMPGPSTDQQIDAHKDVNRVASANQLGDSPSHEPSSNDKNAKEPTTLPLSELIKEELQALAQGNDVFATQALDILEGLENNEISLSQALNQLDELSNNLETHLDHLDQNLEEDPTLINEALRDLSETWRSSPSFAKAARSMTLKDMESGLEALDQALLSESMENDQQQALAASEKSLDRSIRRKTSTSRELAEAERRIRRNKRKPQESEQDYERRLKRQKETLERLQRQKKREQTARQELEKLRRLSKNARRRGSRSKSAQERRKLSESMKKLIRRHQKPRRRRRVQEILEETKAMIRRSSRKDKRNDRRKKQQQRFDRMASGQKDRADQTTLYVESELQIPQNNGPQMEDEQPGGEADNGQSSNQSKQEPRNTSGQTSNSAQGIGDGTDDSTSQARQKKFRSRSRSLRGQTTKGTSRAEVIEVSSQSGFAKHSYRDVYQDYHSFAQSVMDRENLPESQRSLVRRYFRLISPRQAPTNKDEQP